MKILFDHQVFTRQRFGGVSRYFASLANQLPQIGVQTKIGVLLSHNVYLKKTDGPVNVHTQKYVNIKKPILTFLKKSMLIRNFYDLYKQKRNKRYSIRLLQEGNYDLFHPTGIDPYFLDYLNGKPYVVTIHDMIHELFPQHFLSTNDVTEKKRLLVKKATRVIAISENTKKDVLKFLDVPPEKIDVIYHGSGLNFQKQQPVKIPGPYVLFVGGRDKYKNFDFLVTSIASLLKKQNIYLFCAGGDPFSDTEKRTFEEYGLTSLILHAKVSDPELAYLYSHAEVFIFPSLYEGFGIPILEAFDGKCPVLLSDIACFREIAENAALYFDTTNKNSLRSALESILYNQELRKNLIRMGTNRLTMFSEKKCAIQTLSTYKKAAQMK